MLATRRNTNLKGNLINSRLKNTQRALKHRRKEHLADIKYTRDRPVSTRVNKHSNHTGKIIPSIIEIINLDPELQSTTDFRRKGEIYWIYQLKTQSPFGLNTFS